MSMIATAVRHLMAAGVTGEALIAAIADMEAARPVDAVADKRRAYDRERKRKAKADNSTGIPPESVENAESAEQPPSLDKEGFPQTPIQEIKPIPRVSTALARATRIPQDWVPAKPLPPEVAELCAQWPPGRYERELAGFRDYWVSRVKDAARTDWDRTWWNRIRDQHDRILRDSRNGIQRNTTAANDGNGPTVRAAIRAKHILDQRAGLV